MGYKILSRKELCLNQYELVIEAPHVVRNAQAGQFIIFRTEENGERVPLTIADVDKANGELTIVFMAVGYSTKKLAELNIDYTVEGKKHTPHDCRHTFSALCEQYEVNENDRKRMMGHSFGNDITNATYGHRTTEQLRKEIEKIKMPAKPSIIQICC